MKKGSRVTKHDKCVLFKPVSVVTGENGKPISIDDQLFVAEAGIRDGEKLLKKVVKTGKFKKEHLRVEPYYLVSGEKLKALCDKK
jgi:hypothetical protein